VRMAQIVKTNACDLLALAHSAERSSDVVGMKGPFAIDAPTEDEGRWTELRTGRLGPAFSLTTVPPHDLDGCLVESDATGRVRLRGLLDRAVRYGGDRPADDDSRPDEVDITPLEPTELASTHARSRSEEHQRAGDRIVFHSGLEHQPDHGRRRRLDLDRPTSRERCIRRGIPADQAPSDCLSQSAAKDGVDLPNRRGGQTGLPAERGVEGVEIRSCQP